MKRKDTTRSAEHMAAAHARREAIAAGATCEEANYAAHEAAKAAHEAERTVVRRRRIADDEPRRW